MPKKVRPRLYRPTVSVLFNEPKLLKSRQVPHAPGRSQSFSALQRAEIAEIRTPKNPRSGRFWRFSALQRAEIAEMKYIPGDGLEYNKVSVLFNEPKLLKSRPRCPSAF